MRALVAAAVLVATSCGGSGGRRATLPKGLVKGATVTISDGSQIYDALNTTDCVKWPSPAVKKKAGRAGWSGFNPDAGLEGKVLATLGHCDGRTQVVLVEVGTYVVPVTSKGVEVGSKKDEEERVAIGALVGGEIVEGGELVGVLGGYGYGGFGYGGVIGYTGASFAPGDAVRLLDVGDVYSTINTTDCFVGWPSDDVKQRAGEGSWGSWTPSNGDTGVVIGVGSHCSTGDALAIVDVGGYLVPIGAKSIEAY